MPTQTDSYPSATALDTFLATHSVVVTQQPATHPEEIICTVDTTSLPPGSPIPPIGIMTFRLGLLPKETPFIIGAGYLHLIEITLAEHSLRYQVLTNEITLHGDTTLLNLLLHLCEHLSHKRSADFLSHATLRERRRLFDQPALTSNIILRKHISPTYLVEGVHQRHDAPMADGTDHPDLYTGTLSHYRKGPLDIIDNLADENLTTTSIKRTRHYHGVYHETIGTFSSTAAANHSRFRSIEHHPYIRTLYYVDDSNCAFLEQVRKTKCVDNTLVTTDTVTRYYPLMPAYLEGQRVWSQSVQGEFEKDSLNAAHAYTVITELTNGGRQLFHSHPEKGCFTVTYLNATTPSQFTLHIGRFHVNSDEFIKLLTPVCEQLDLKLGSRPHLTQADMSLMLLETGHFNAQQCLHNDEKDSATSARIEYMHAACTAQNFFDALITQHAYDVKTLGDYITAQSAERLSSISGFFMHGHASGPSKQSHYEMQNGSRIEIFTEATCSLGKKQGPGSVFKHFPPTDTATDPLHFKTVILEDCYFKDDQPTVNNTVVFELWLTSSAHGGETHIYVKEMQYNQKGFLRYDLKTHVIRSVGDYRPMFQTLRACECNLKLIYPNLQEMVVGRRQGFPNKRELLSAESAVATVAPNESSDDDETPAAQKGCAAAARTAASQSGIAQQSARHRTLQESLGAQQTLYQQQARRYRALQEQPSTLKKTQSKAIRDTLDKLMADAKEKAARCHNLLDKISQDLKQASATTKQHERGPLTLRAKQRLDEVGLLIQQLNTSCTAMEPHLERLHRSRCTAPEIAVAETPVLAAAATAMLEPPAPETTTASTTLPPVVLTQHEELRRHYQDCLTLTGQAVWQEKLDYLDILMDNAQYTIDTDPEAYMASIKAIEKRWKNIPVEKALTAKQTGQASAVTAQGMFARHVERPTPPDQADARFQKR